MKLWRWKSLPWYKKFDIMAGKFNPKNDSRLKKEFHSRDFVGLIYTLNLLKLNINDHEIKLTLKNCDQGYFKQLTDFYQNGGNIDYRVLSSPLQLRSAYSYIQTKCLGNGKDYWRHFENDFTCMPEDFPFTVDYIL